MSERLIDRQRLQAQAELLQRITKGGEIDMEAAVRERRALADRVENRRTAYIRWMKKNNYPQEIINEGLAEMDKLLATLRIEPFSQQAFEMPDLGF